MTNGIKLTPKQESFVRKYLESGCASTAYRHSYDAGKMKPQTIWSRASELLKNSKVAARISQLKQIIAKRHDVTVDSLISELDDVITEATKDRNWAAVNTSIQLKARITGQMVDRSEHKVDQRVEHRMEVVNKAKSDVLDLIAGLQTEKSAEINQIQKPEDTVH